MPDRSGDPTAGRPEGPDGVPAGPRAGAAEAVRRWWRHRVVPLAFRVTALLARGRAATYLAVASVVGADALALVVGAAAIWPVGIPILLAGLALVYAWRNRFGRLARWLRSRR